MERSKSRKIGLFASISMLIGTIVGIGIFFKNGNVFETNDYNGIGILISWILAAIICLCTALSFAEVGSSVSNNSGLAGWCKTYGGKKFGNTIKLLQPFAYFSVLITSISIFSSEAIFNIFNVTDKIDLIWIMVLGLCLFLFFVILNFLSLTWSSRLQHILTLLKFVPLTGMIFAGIIYGSLHPDLILFNKDSVGEGVDSTPIGNISAIGILTSLPAILFAFDSFTNAGNLSKEMKNPKRNVPLTISISMITVSILYLLITISQIMVSEGVIYGAFDTIAGENNSLKAGLKIFISIFIFIAIIGVLNAFAAFALRACQSLIDSNLIIGTEKIKQISRKSRSDVFGGLILLIVFVTVVWILLAIPSCILQTDAFIDGVSNFPTISFFAVYGTVILLCLVNRKTEKVKVQKMKGFCFFAPLAVFGCYLAFGFQVFYTFTTAVIIDSNSTLSWGLFHPGEMESGTEAWKTALTFLSYFLLIFIFIIINSKKLKESFQEKEINIGVLHD